MLPGLFAHFHQPSDDLDIVKTHEIMMMTMMLIEKAGEVFRRPSGLFNSPFTSFLKHSLAFTHNRDDQHDEDSKMRMSMMPTMIGTISMTRSLGAPPGPNF